MYYTKNLIFVSSLYLILISSLAHSIPASSPGDDDVSPAHNPVFFDKRTYCENCPDKTITDTCTVTKTKTCTVTKKETDTCTVTKDKTVIKKETETCTVTKTKTDTCTVTKIKTDTCTVTTTKIQPEIRPTTKTSIETDTVTREDIKTVTEKETVTKKETDTVTVTDKVTVTDRVTDIVTKSITNTVTTTVLPCNKPVRDTPCDSPMFTFISPGSGQTLKEKENFEVIYNITKLQGDQSGFLKDLNFYLVSSDQYCVNQTIAENADTTPTRVCNKSLQYAIPACANVPPGYYAIQVMYNFCNSTSGRDVCVFHNCERGVVVKP